MEEILYIFWLEGQVTERDRSRDRDRGRDRNRDRDRESYVYNFSFTGYPPRRKNKDIIAKIYEITAMLSSSMIDKYYNKYINTFQIKKIFFTYWYSLKIAPNIYLNFDLRESNCKPEN